MNQPPEPVIVPSSTMSLEGVANLFTSMALEGGVESTYKMFNTRTFRQTLSIPDELWKALDEPLKVKIQEIRKTLRQKKEAKPIPDQYPSMSTANNLATVAHLCNAIHDIPFGELDEDLDDEAISYAHMVSTHLDNTIPFDNDVMKEGSKDMDKDLEIRAHLEYGQNSWYSDKVYAISDGGADSCILGQHAKVLEYTGRHANLVGYHPETTKTDKVPIVTALIKAKSSTTGNYPVLLKVHEAPFYKNSPVTLLSEYQI
jgi:hypothetical protein